MLEYKVIQSYRFNATDFHLQLNGYAKQGWEFVSHIDLPQGLFFIFKKETAND
jgi:hypothetical protein